MKRLVKYHPGARRSKLLSGHTSSARALPLQPAKGCARERVTILTSSSHSSSRLCSQQGDSPLYSRSPWHIMCRRTGGFDRRSSALLRTALTCGHTSVRACSSSLTTSQTYTGALTPVLAVASATNG